MSHVRAAWDFGKQQPTELCPRRRRKRPPAGICAALLWQRDCPDYEAWLLGQIAHWRCQKLALSDATRAWRAKLSAHSRSVLPEEYNGALHRELLLASGHSDVTVLRDIETGFRMRGTLPDSTLFDSLTGA